MTAIANYHKHEGLKQQRSVLTGLGPESEIRVGAGVCLFRKLLWESPFRPGQLWGLRTSLHAASAVGLCWTACRWIKATTESILISSCLTLRQKDPSPDKAGVTGRDWRVDSPSGGQRHMHWQEETITCICAGKAQGPSRCSSCRKPTRSAVGRGA